MTKRTIPKMYSCQQQIGFLFRKTGQSALVCSTLEEFVQSDDALFRQYGKRAHSCCSDQNSTWLKKSFMDKRPTFTGTFILHYHCNFCCHMQNIFVRSLLLWNKMPFWNLESAFSSLPSQWVEVAWWGWRWPRCPGGDVTSRPCQTLRWEWWRWWWWGGGGWW